MQAKNASEKENEKNTLKLSVDLDKINQAIEKAKNAKNTWYITIGDRAKTLHLSKKAVEVLNENGVKLEKTYISSKTPAVYNAIHTILSENSQVFTKLEK